MRSPGSGTPAYVHVPELGEIGATVLLDVDESRYVARVCRVRSGETVRATDGAGRLADLRVVSVERGVRARVETIETRERTRRSWVVSGAPERGREDWMIEKLAELGVERWIPIDAARGRWEGSRRRLDRWERIAIAAMRQSMSAFRMEVGEVVSLERAVECVPSSAGRWLASMAGPPGAPDAGRDLQVVVVGPAGGLTPDEEHAIGTAGFRPIRLADHRLRTETAAVAWAARRAG